MQMYLCKGYDYGEKVDLSQGIGIQKEKCWLPRIFQG